MLVYVVEWSDGYEESGICEIFADEGKAEEYAKFHEDNPDNIVDGEPYIYYTVTGCLLL